jgi:hypothetical protein
VVVAKRDFAMRTKLLVTLVGLIAFPNTAEAGCVMRDWVVAELSRQYDETPIARAVTQSGELLEVLASRHGESWTMLITQPTGMTCTLIEGEDWQVTPPALALKQAEE